MANGKGDGAAVVRKVKRKLSRRSDMTRRAFTARLGLDTYKQLRQRAVDLDCPLQSVLDTAIAEYFSKASGGRGKRRRVDPLQTVTVTERALLESALSLLRSRVREARGMLVALLHHWASVEKGRGRG